MKLTSEQVRELSRAVCGDGSTPFKYRSRDDLEEFRAYLGNEIEYVKKDARFGDTTVILALVDRREFSTDAHQDPAIDWANTFLALNDLAACRGSDGEVHFEDKAYLRGQAYVRRQIQGSYEALLESAGMPSALDYFRRGLERLNANPPHHRNAVKEAVCSMEAVVETLTGESDFTKAFDKEPLRSLIPRPLAEKAKKLYAYRGDEPGVGHGGKESPSVDEVDANFAVLVSANLGMYIVEKINGAQG